jgi:hypothetical protein
MTQGHKEDLEKKQLCPCIWVHEKQIIASNHLPRTYVASFASISRVPQIK